MKNGSGARKAIPQIPIAANRWVAIAKTITPVQKMEQKIAATKHTRKNHFMLMNVNGMFRQLPLLTLARPPIARRLKEIRSKPTFHPTLWNRKTGGER